MLESIKIRGIIYDWEIYRNCWTISCYSFKADKILTFIKYKDRDDTNEFIRVAKSIINKEKRILIGFNSLRFDDALTNHLINNPKISNYDLWLFAQTLIKGEKNPYRYDNHFESLDVLEVMRAGYSTISLKGAAVNLKFNKIQDLPIHYESEIEDYQLDTLISYNINDLEITKECLYYLLPRLEMRELLSNNYKLNLLTLSDSGIAKELFNRIYIDKVKEKNNKVDIKKVRYSRTERPYIKLTNVISPEISFISDELNEYLDYLKTIVLGEPVEEENNEDDEL